MRLFLNERKNLKKLEKFNWRCKKKWIVWMQHGKIQRTWFEMLWFLLLIDCSKRLLLSLKELQTGLKRIQNLLHEYSWQSQLSLDWLLLWADWLLHFLQFERQSQCFLDLSDGLSEQLLSLQLHGVKTDEESKRRLKLLLIKSKKSFDRGLINFKLDGKNIEMLSWKEFEKCFDLSLIWLEQRSDGLQHISLEPSQLLRLDSKCFLLCCLEILKKSETLQQNGLKIWMKFWLLLSEIPGNQ